LSNTEFFLHTILLKIIALNRKIVRYEPIIEKVTGRCIFLTTAEIAIAHISKHLQCMK